ncbi:MAG: 16S rRNA (uracil(1498)-N(3))-methyltransferase [Clostridia bacterium]|nr:16S rRNA (uracil(1498)-N(3))-methyltransferase [Clostridia bacterium]
MPKFFVKYSDVIGQNIKITGEDASHIKKVLRLRSGDSINISDDQGNDYHARIAKIEADYVLTQIESSSANISEPSIEVTLFQGLPKSDKMDLIVQKNVELGIAKIVPVITEHTVVKLDSKKDAENKIKRWQRISMEAAKQSNRGRIPEVSYPVSFEEAISLSANCHLRLIPYEKEKQMGLRKCLHNICGVKNAAVFIGPEGGFSEKEIQTALESGVIPVTLGPRILRTETAGLMVQSILMFALGEIG